MITETLIVAMVTLLSIVIAHAVLRTIRMHQVYVKHKKELNGLPIVPEVWSPGGNMHSMVFDKDLLFKIETYFRTYGKTFGWTYGTLPMVYTADIELLKTVAKDETGVNVNRVNIGLPMFELEYDCIAFVADDQWRRIRQAISPSFTKHKVQTPNVNHEIDSVIENLVNSIETRMKESKRKDYAIDVDADDMILRYATDLIFSCFYKQYNLVDYHKEKDWYTHLVEDGLNSFVHPIVEITCSLPFIKPVTDWLIMNFHSMGTGRRVVMDFIRRQLKLNMSAKHEIAKAKKEGTQIDPDNLILPDGTKFQRNMMDAFIDNYHDGKVTRDEYLNSSFFLFLAGIKTMADGLSRLLYYLAHYTEVQDKLRHSIEKDGIESEYLSWVINELLRIEPPAPIGCSRRTERDVQVEGGTIPKGTFVMTCAYTIHRMPEYWGQDANQFKPERWADADKFHPLQYFPFGSGRRGCPGKEFALHSMRKALAQLLTRYKFERCEKTSDSLLARSPFFIYMLYSMPTYVKISKII